ncbi:glutathione S-transferase [Mycena sanguinolenta]|nr:glutathione S-transferase [Mycena sanguinolenta]
MVLKFYGVPYPGGGSGLVYLLLAEKQIPFELIAVDLKAKEQKKPEFLAMHPFGQVPVIDDDGFIVYESRAICRYLADKYADQGPNLFPKGLQERTMVEQGAAVESAQFKPAISKLFKEGGKRLRGLPFDQAIIDEAHAELSAVLDVYEIILGKQKFLGGDEYSLADLFHFGDAPQLADNGTDIMTSKGRPNATRWWNELTARPVWAKLTADHVRYRAGN